ncbi:MAG TPA: aconitate hydratase [Solirubrobacteraceae bacterium]|nr:aconitate hydratase [Solirubrobacteraceae bacterium]
MSTNSFDARRSLQVGARTVEIFRLDALASRFDVARLPFSLKILLENLLRTEGNGSVTAADIEALAGWDPMAEPSTEIAFTPARVVMQDFTGVPAVVDLAAMRDAMAAMGGDPAMINPLVPAELVIDHSVQVDAFGSRDAFTRNAEREFERNEERYAFLRWGQTAFDDFAVVPPDTGIVHQVNLEYLARVVFVTKSNGSHPSLAYPDTLVGTDSHTTMINGLGVLGWGVGGIEAEAAMLGQPMPMLIPQVLGFKLRGELPEGATATDLVLTVTEMLRERGVVGKFVEFYGQGLASLPLADRATIGNMSPEFGSTCAIFPIDAETIRYLRFSGRTEERIELVEAYAREQGLWHDENSPEPAYSDTIELDLGEVVPSLAGPKRPQDRVALSDAKAAYRIALKDFMPHEDGEDADGGDTIEFDALSFPASDPPTYTGRAGIRPPEHATAPGHAEEIAAAMLAEPEDNRVFVTMPDGTETSIDNGHVVIAAITSCTNTSNPSVMLAAGLLARNAVARGLTSKPWVKTSLAPGSKVVTKYLDHAALTGDLEALGFHLVGYGCTTCIGNSGPLPRVVSEAVGENDLAVVSVLSGNRNFEGRINPDVKMNYLASPPLVVAYALAGSMDADIVNDPIGVDPDGVDVYLRDLWPSTREVGETVERAVRSEMFRSSYDDVFAGDERWNSLDVPIGDRFAWDETSTYVHLPPYFEGMPADAPAVADIEGARVLALLGDSVTTDHISPAGAIKPDSPAGLYLQEHGVAPRDFNSYGARRGNHEVMVRGTFANIRLKNLLETEPALPEGGFTLKFNAHTRPEPMSIYDASLAYLAEGTPLVVLAGKEYGSGSSRDWAAKGTRLLGVRAVLAQSFERIHRSNLIGMGVLPLQLPAPAEDLGLHGDEVFSITGLADAMNAGEPVPQEVSVRAGDREFKARVRIDTPKEAEYFRHGGILQYVLRQLRDR